MHALHRPHLHRAIAITVAAAVLAIILTLVIASGLSDLTSPRAQASLPGTVQVSALHRGPNPSPFTHSPFTSLLTAPVAPPWASTAR